MNRLFISTLFHLFNRRASRRLLLYLAALLWFGNLQSQSSITIDSIKAIQSKKIPALQREGKFEEAIALNITAIKNANRLHYKVGIAQGYYQIANSLWLLGKNQESLRYLKLAKNISAKLDDRTLYIRVLDCFGRNYTALKIHKKSIEQYDEALRAYEKYEVNNKNVLTALYGNRAAAFDEMHMTDSSLANLRKSIDIRPTLMEYLGMAYQYLHVLHNVDSAAFYLEKANAFRPSNVSAYQQTVMYLQYGNLYKAQGQYDVALSFYDSALFKARKIKRYEQEIKAINQISETYQLLGNKEKSYEYLKTYTALQDSANSVKSKEVNAVVDSFLKEQEDSYAAERRKLVYIILAIVLLSMMVVVSLYLIYRHRRAVRLKQIEEKEMTIQEKVKESEKLKSQLNEAFAEVAALASENSPYFLARFQEVYPDVCTKLMAINPSLVNTELSLCAMLWLNFSTKEIAQFTFIQPKTVQVKKHRLRKKLGIQDGADIYYWIKNL